MSGPIEIHDVAAFTIAHGETSRRESRDCEASFCYWHPDVPFLCIDEKACSLLMGDRPAAWLSEIVSLRSLAGWFLSRRLKRLIYLDSDIFVVGRLEALLDPTNGTSWTSDIAEFAMGVPECPRLNSGVLASSEPEFWQTWTAAQYGCLMPAVAHFFFDQLSLRLLVHGGAIRGRVIDGQPGIPYYNIAIREQPGDWRVENGAVFKGTERAIIFHQAGEQQRGVAAAPEALRARLAEIASPHPIGPTIDFHAWWDADGAAFTAQVQENFSRWPTITLETVLADAYAKTPGQFRTVAPVVWDRHRKLEGTPWKRLWNRNWQAYLYYREGG
jgi:hypothetical protein